MVRGEPVRVLNSRTCAWNTASSAAPAFSSPRSPSGPPPSAASAWEWRRDDVEEAKRCSTCLDAGVNLIDTADVYSRGRSEEILGSAMEGRRERVLVATKVRFRMGDGPNDPACRAHIPRLRGEPEPAGPTTSTSTRCTSGTA